MDRNVISQRDAVKANVKLGDNELKASPQSQSGSVSPVKADDYGGRLLKYIPPDVIGAFTAIEGIIQGGFQPDDPQGQKYAWVVFLTILVGTPLYLWRVGNVKKIPQLVISTVAFVVWAFAYPGPPFGMLGLNKTVSSIVLMLYVFLIPIWQA